MEKKKTDSPADRLIQVIETKKLGSRANLAELIGVTSGAIYNAIKRGEITKQMAFALQGAVGISANWILKGEGPMEAGPELSLDFTMTLEMLSHIRDLRRQIPTQLTSFWFKQASTNQSHALHALAWRVIGKDLFDKPPERWLMLIQLKEPTQFNDFSRKYSEYESKFEEVSQLLWDVRGTQGAKDTLNLNLIDDDFNAALRTRIYADTKDSSLLDQWRQETKHHSEEKRKELSKAYQYACALRSEAEQIFQISEFGKDYAEGMLYNEDANAIKFAGKLTPDLIIDLWTGKISPSELYISLRKATS